MPVTALRMPVFKPQKEVVVSWDTWRQGMNTLLRENELKGSEMVESTNIMLIGSGVPTKRWGSRDYYLAGATGSTQFVGFIKNASDTIQELSFTDWGFFTKKSGSSYSVVTGASWPSGSIPSATQLGDNYYIVSENREMVRYNFTNLVNFATISMPAGVAATNLSSATGTTTYSWRITAVGKSGGETLASTPISLASLPQTLSNTLIRVTWTPVSAASGDLTGYNVYRGPLGDEKWVGGVDDTTTRFDDYGETTTDPFRVVPTVDTTGGPKAKYIIRYQDRLILAGIPGSPTKVLISGRYPNQERFDWYAGGGFILIEPDSGENITGLGIHQEKIIVFKEHSVWQLNLNQVQFGQYLILDPQYRLLTASQGCSSHRSIVSVENDLMFSNEKGVYILRYEPQLQNILNANEISAKIRPFFESLSQEDHNLANAGYPNKKYTLSYPISKKTIVFDRERLCFYGPWPTPFGINQWAKYTDSGGTERWVVADADDNYVSEFSADYSDDKNTAIRTVFKSKREDLGDWTAFKTLNEVYMNFRSIYGSIDVNVYIENRDGNTIAAKSFTLTGITASGSSGLGMNEFGMIGFGLTTGTTTTATAETPKKAYIYKPTRIFQFEIRTNGNTDNYELLGLKAIATIQSRGNSPSSWRAD